jgi:chromosome segregation ATPase
MRAAQRERAEAERRLAHLKAAIENLHAAGLHEPAEHLLREAEQIKQHLQGPPGPLPPELERAKATVYRLQAEINELRQAVQELRKRVDELTEKRR